MAEVARSDPGPTSAELDVAIAEIQARPILFSGPMVRAILEGRKTQTRRIVREQPWPEGTTPWPGGFDDAPNWCPYGRPGDRLWVRETWGFRGSTWKSTAPKAKVVHIAYQADDTRRSIMRAAEDESGLPEQVCRCKGEGDQLDRYNEHHEELVRYWRSWRPSIHMSRWMSRIALEITDVRVERLQAITAADAQAEGMPTHVVELTFRKCYRDAEERGRARLSCFREGWDRINGKRGAWASNPWVWVVSFRRLRA